MDAWTRLPPVVHPDCDGGAMDVDRRVASFKHNGIGNASTGTSRQAAASQVD